MPPERKPEETDRELRPGRNIEITGPCRLRWGRKTERGVSIIIETIPTEIRRSIDKVSTSE